MARSDAISTSTGIAIIAAAALILAVTLTVIFFRRRRDRVAHEEATAAGMVQVLPSNAEELGFKHATLRHKGPVYSVSRRNLNPSIILPLPLPPIPACRSQSSKPSPDAPTEAVSRHHVHAPRPPASSLSPSLQRSAVFLGSTLHMSPTSSVRSSWLAYDHALSANGSTTKVHSEFTPQLPDELVLRPGEEVTLLQIFNDGWCIVGRKRPFVPPSPPAESKRTSLFGQKSSFDDVEIGAIPMWVLETRPKGSAVPQRPERKASLGVPAAAGRTDCPLSGNPRSVISWSNF